MGRQLYHIAIGPNKQSDGFVIDAIGPELVGYEGPNLRMIICETYKIPSAARVCVFEYRWILLKNSVT